MSFVFSGGALKVLTTSATAVLFLSGGNFDHFFANEVNGFGLISANSSRTKFSTIFHAYDIADVPRRG